MPVLTQCKFYCRPEGVLIPYAIEDEAGTPCSECEEPRIEALCGMGYGCGRPAIVVTDAEPFIFCAPCYGAFVLGQGYPNRRVVLSSDDEKVFQIQASYGRPHLRPPLDETE